MYHHQWIIDPTTNFLCQQSDSLYPNHNAQLAAELNVVYANPDFKRDAYHALSGAIQIPSVSSSFLFLHLTRFAEQSLEMTAVPSTKIPYGTRLQIFTTIYNKHFPSCQLLVSTHPLLASSRFQIRQIERHKGKHLRSRIPLAGLHRCKTFLINCPPRLVTCHHISHHHSHSHPDVVPVDPSSLSMGALTILGRL